MNQTTETTEPGQEDINALIALYGQGQLEAAIGRGEALAASFPRSAPLQNILGAANAGLRRHDTAMRHYARAIELKPDFASAHNNLANSLKDSGRTDEAIAGYRRALEIKPDYANAHNNLGNALLEAGRGEEAVASYRRAFAIQPDYADAHYNLGNALKQLDRLDEAAAAFEDSLRLKPDRAEAHNNLGNTLKELGRGEEAVACFERAVRIRPDYADAHNNLGLALRALERKEEASASFRHALRAQPDHIDAHINLGNILQEFHHKDQAIACFETALRLKPDYDAVRAQKLHQQAHICDWDAIAAEAAAIPRLGIAGDSVSPFAMLTLEDAPERHRVRSELYATQNLGDIVAEPIARPAARPGKLRVGYFSADFHNHATMYLMARLFELHDRDRFEIHAYSYGPAKHDEMQQRVRGSVDVFHDVRALDDQAIAELARRDGLDIAIDLKGHTGEARLGIFARRAAPVQIAFLGYPGTTGAAFIDYLVADKVVIPDAERRHYSESIIYLPGSYQVNDDSRPISPRAITRAEAGLPEDAFVFCCFNNNYKITPVEFDIWMRLLGKVENSVLWLLKINASVDVRLYAEARKRGIDPARIVFAGYLPHADHLARQRHADLFLDTFDCNAHTTASDALWAGLPLLTRTGRGFASRVAASLLRAVGLAELVTDSAEAYEALALELATNPGRLAEIRARLAANRLTEPLFRTEDYARKIEQAFELAYQGWLDGNPPVDIAV